ncbi:ribonuclease H family protein [Cytobacillus spongiae]|uniref:ribonuclease H1 domain-containing protein n=1 Tax=Cytobacillus spongiae TaxID=2901381 RepID=UPI001F4071BA|nr:ribonuclease H family protein [Cytobacillus spongiae]UII56247.1 ribonuclease H family protein [Cytobacillus spongiae]
MSKFYAVRRGKKTGIFNTWNECKESVEGFSNAEYKSFTSMEEAQLFLNVINNNVVSKEVKNELDCQVKTIRAYVDGSYSKHLGKYAYGCVLIHGDNITRLSGAGVGEGESNLWNVSGELHGANKAIEWSIENKFERIIIFYDYEGIAKWANGEWKAKKEETKQYIESIEKHKKLITIEFIKVKAHSGDKYNEEADKLAKEALIGNKTNEKQVQKSQPEDKTLLLFRDVINSEEQVKNSISFSYNGYKLTESKLKKFAKEYWKTSGNKINEIESFEINFDYIDGLLSWEYIKKDGDKYNFKLLID